MTREARVLVPVVGPTPGPVLFCAIAARLRSMAEVSRLRGIPVATLRAPGWG